MTKNSVKKNEDLEKTNIEEVFNKLKESPLYNLSMSSLENFHTNFLVWLGNTYPEQTWTLLTGKQETPQNINFEAQKNCGKNCKFDLCVKEKDNIILVLENKIKSYPTEEQLKKYNEGIGNSNCKKILLTLFPFTSSNPGWTVLHYSELVKNWETSFNFSDVIYPEALVIDYFNMIEKIVNIVGKAIEKEEVDKYDIYKIADDLEDFHDVYVKYRTFNLMNFIKEYVKIDTKDIKFSTDFSNSNEGVINIEKQYNEKIILSIQIQGQEYRHCLVYDKDATKQDRYNFAEKLEFWFNDDKGMNTYTKRSSYACCQRPEDKKIKYRGYSPDRIYRHIDINNLEEANGNDILSYNSIAEKVSEDIKNLNSNEGKIIACYNQILPQKNSLK